MHRNDVLVGKIFTPKLGNCLPSQSKISTPVYFEESILFGFSELFESTEQLVTMFYSC